MPFLQSSGAISIANLNSFFPGSGTAMSNFYRGGGRVPATKTVEIITRDPTSGEYYSRTTSDYSVWTDYQGSGTIAFKSNANNPAAGWQPPWISGVSGSSWTTGGFTYYRGSIRESYTDEYGTTNFHGIFRTSSTFNTVNINTGIPSSGAISLSQFYGAETP